MGRLAVLVPVKAFADAKARLAPALGPAARVRLSQRLAEGVVASCAGLPVHVVCDDPGVAAWARALGAVVAWTPGLGLNGAVGAAVEEAGSLGYDRVVVAHGDLARPASLPLVSGAEDAGVLLVPDRRDDGTNVLAVPTGTGFTFAYGAGSFGRHLDEAVRIGLPATVHRDADLALDVDLPEDLPLVGCTA